MRHRITALRTVFQRARDRNLKLRLRKCELFLLKVEFLGHEVSANGIHSSNKKVEAIANIAVPTTCKQAHSFVCLAGYYHKFIKDFTEIAKPLFQLVTKENSEEPFEWTTECQQFFETIKERLSTYPVLAHPVHGKPFIIELDSISRDLMTQKFYFRKEEFTFPWSKLEVSVSCPLKDGSQGRDVFLWASRKDQQVVHVEETSHLE